MAPQVCNTPLSLSRSARQKINREIREITDVMTQIDLTDIYRTFDQNTKEYTFISAPHGTFAKTEHKSGHKSQQIHTHKM